MVASKCDSRQQIMIQPYPNPVGGLHVPTVRRHSSNAAKKDPLPYPQNMFFPLQVCIDGKILRPPIYYHACESTEAIYLQRYIDYGSKLGIPKKYHRPSTLTTLINLLSMAPEILRSKQRVAPNIIHIQ